MFDLECEHCHLSLVTSFPVTLDGSGFASIGECMGKEFVEGEGEAGLSETCHYDGSGFLAVFRDDHLG